MVPVRPTKTVSVSPSGTYRVVVRRLLNKGDDDFVNAEILLVDRKGQTVLNVSPTNNRKVEVTWRRDEKAIIVNNVFAIDGDWLVYALETKPGHWEVKRSSTQYSEKLMNYPSSILDPGGKKYSRCRYEIFGIDFQGQNVVAVITLIVFHPSNHQRKGKVGDVERRYILDSHEITRFPTPHQLKSLEAALDWSS